MIRRKIILAILAAACAAFLLISFPVKSQGYEGDEHLTIPSDGSCILTSLPLQPSDTYDVRVVGFWLSRQPSEPGGEIDVDGAGYVSVAGGSWSQFDPAGVYYPPTPTNPWRSLSFSSIHDYTSSIVGSGTTICFYIYDDPGQYGNNTGSVDIYIHHVISATDTPTPSDTPFPCGGFLCVTPASFSPVCTVTPISTASNTPTQQFVNSTHVFPTVAPFPTIPTSTPNSTWTVTPGPSSTEFQTSTVTASPGPSPTITPTTQCIPGNYTPIVNYNEHDIPGGACYRLFPPIGFIIDALTIPVVNWTILPQITIIVHPVDFCYTTFVLDISFAGIDLWSWVELIFDIILAAWSASTILTGQ